MVSLRSTLGGKPGVTGPPSVMFIDQADTSWFPPSHQSCVFDAIGDTWMLRIGRDILTRQYLAESSVSHERIPRLLLTT